MNSFYYQQQFSDALQGFPHIIELACRKIQQIELHSFTRRESNCLHVFFIHEGKFEWCINGQSFTLYPGDVSIILPHQEFGSDQGYLDLGIISWLALKPANFESQNDLQLGAWSGIPEAEARSMGKLLCMNDVSTMPQLPVAGQLLHTMQTELSRQEIGYTARVNQLIDELLITLVRHLSRQSKLQRDFPKSFMKLEQSLRSNLSHQWLVEEMAVMVGLGTTAFTEKVKSYTGFSPLHYLINIRIAEAIRLLKNTDLPVTDIALDTGFYSSQHFATTFKKLTGYTPRHFRQNNKKNS